jgi:hypothetical protein
MERQRRARHLNGRNESYMLNGKPFLLDISYTFYLEICQSIEFLQNQVLVAQTVKSADVDLSFHTQFDFSLNVRVSYALVKHTKLLIQN